MVDYFRRQRVLQRSALPIPAEVQDFVRTRAAEMVAARAPRDDRRAVGGVRGGAVMVWAGSAVFVERQSGEKENH